MYQDKSQPAPPLVENLLRNQILGFARQSIQVTGDQYVLATTDRRTVQTRSGARVVAR